MYLLLCWAVDGVGVDLEVRDLGIEAATIHIVDHLGQGALSFAIKTH